jgi:hypothetical protein
MWKLEAPEKYGGSVPKQMTMNGKHAFEIEFVIADALAVSTR